MDYLDYNGQSYSLVAFSIDALAAEGVPQHLLDQVRRQRASERIDKAAGLARLRFVSPGALVVEEYRAARQAVQRWRDSGSPADDIPDEIVSGAEYSDISPEDAALEIEQADTAYRSGLAAIRRSRLAGKRASNNALGESIDQAADTAIAELDAIQPSSSMRD